MVDLKFLLIFKNTFIIISPFYVSTILMIFNIVDLKLLLIFKNTFIIISPFVFYQFWLFLIFLI